MPRLLLADRVKGREDSFLAPLLPALAKHYETRFVTAGPGEDLATAIAWADIVWLEWCWDHAVWATRNAIPPGKPCIVRLHSIEALQTNYPAGWIGPRHAPDHRGRGYQRGSVFRFPAIAATVPIQVIPNGIDMERFKLGAPDRFQVGWVGHLEPKKNPMLMMQIAHRICQRDPVSASMSPADSPTADHAVSEADASRLGVGWGRAFRRPCREHAGMVCRQGRIALNIHVRKLRHEHRRGDGDWRVPGCPRLPRRGPAMANGCLFASVDDAVALIQAGRPMLYREWVAERYGLDRQVDRLLALLKEVSG